MTEVMGSESGAPMTEEAVAKLGAASGAPMALAMGAPEFRDSLFSHGCPATVFSHR